MNEDIFSFESFRFSPVRRRLDRDGQRLAIGSRAVEILWVLLERAGTVVSHKDLMSTVWPDLVVNDVNVRVNIAKLRRVLGDAGGCIQNIPRRGYRFAAPVFRTNSREAAPATPNPGAQP